MSEGKFSLKNVATKDEKDLAQKKFQTDVKRLFERLFSVA